MLNVSSQNYLGRELQGTRKALGLPQCRVAASASLSVPTVRLLERGRGNISSWERVLSALNVELVGRNLPPGVSLGARVATLRKRRGLSQRALAAIVGTTLAVESVGEIAGYEKYVRWCGRTGAVRPPPTRLTGCEDASRLPPISWQ